MKYRIYIDFNADEDYNDREIHYLTSDLEDYIKNHELCYFAKNVSVKFQDEHCIKEERKKLKKQIPTKPYTRDLWELGTAEGYSCPTCGYDFPVSYFEPYCCKCGQAIKYKHKDHPTEKGGARNE